MSAERVELGEDTPPVWKCGECGTTRNSEQEAEECCTDGLEEESSSHSESLDFTNPESGVFPAACMDRQQWMAHSEKKPFAPWGDRDAPAECNDNSCPAETADSPECDCDARWKWGYEGFYVDGETVASVEDDDRVDGRAFLQQAEDPFMFVDGDDVRCPETGRVHPQFREVLFKLGATYTDVSTSGSGAHAVYFGELPDGLPQTAWAIDDEPWGANDDLPEIELYANRHVCVMTGEHVPGTPDDVCDVDEDALWNILDQNGLLPTEKNREGPDFELQDYEPEATSADETTDDIRDIFAAIDRLDARRVAEETIVHRWNDDASTSGEHRAFVPSWGKDARGTANIVNREIWQDTGGGGYGGPVAMALIDLAEMRPSNASPRDTGGEKFFKGVEHLRDLGFPIPELDDTPDHPVYDVTTGIEIHLYPVTGKESKLVVLQNGVQEYSERVDTPVHNNGAAFWESPRKRSLVAGRIVDSLTGIDPDGLKDRLKKTFVDMANDSQEDEWCEQLRTDEYEMLMERTKKVVCHPTTDGALWSVEMAPHSDRPEIGEKALEFDEGGLNDSNPANLETKHLGAFLAKIDVDPATWEQLQEEWIGSAEAKKLDEGDDAVEQAVEEFLYEIAESYTLLPEDSKGSFSWDRKNGLYAENDYSEAVVYVPGTRVAEYKDKHLDDDDVNLSVELRERGVMVDTTKRKSINGTRKRVWPIAFSQIDRDEDELDGMETDAEEAPEEVDL